MKALNDHTVLEGRDDGAGTSLSATAPHRQEIAGDGERRIKSRQPVKPGVFAILRAAKAAPPHIQDLGMGDIAFAMYRLNPLHMGQVHDISAGGLSFSYVESGTAIDDPLALDILSAETGFHLTGLSFRIVWDRGLADDIDVDYMPLRQAGLAFEVPLHQQRRQLEVFMRHHARN